MNDELLKLRDRHGWTADKIYKLLNQGNTKIALSTVRQWYVAPGAPSHLKLKGHWYDLILYRIADSKKKKAG